MKPGRVMHYKFARGFMFDSEHVKGYWHKRTSAGEVTKATMCAIARRMLGVGVFE